MSLWSMCCRPATRNRLGASKNLHGVADLGGRNSRHGQRSARLRSRRIDGYVPMDAALGDMVTAIENVVRGELACSPRVAATLFQRIGFPSFSRAVTPNHLTTRELQVADLINRGCPTKEIAWRLGVQPCTAKNHVRNILHKLEVRRRGQAVAKLRTLIGERFTPG